VSFLPPPRTSLRIIDNSALTACAQQYLPEYGPDFQVHVQTPFNKLNLYTATLTILGEDEPLLHTRFCRTPVEALSNLRIMIMVCEDPDTKSRVARAREKNMRRKQERTAKEGNDDPFKEGSNEDPFEHKSDDGPLDHEETARKIQEGTMREEADLWAQEKLARQQWDFTVRHFAGKKSRLETASRKSKSKTEVTTEDL
jgi:hypothetical protein